MTLNRINFILKKVRDNDVLYVRSPYFYLEDNMKKIALIAGAVVAVLALTGCSKKQEAAKKGEFTVEAGKLKVAMEIGYPPFEYFAEDGKTPTGFDVELGKAVSERLGLSVEFVDTAWDGILAGLDTDRYDCIMSAMTITDERKANYDFSTPYIGNGQAIILTKDSKLSIAAPEDLKGLKVGYQAETTSDFYLEKYAAAHGFTYVQNEYDKVMNAYKDLEFGRIDAVISDSLVAVSYLGKPDIVFKQVWAGTPDDYFGVCVKKGNKALLDKINSAIADMKADGTMTRIYMKIFNVDLSDSIKDVQ